MDKHKKDVIVSRFETYGDDFRFDDNKSICNISVNIKEQIISFTHESGDVPTLYVILMAMSVNKAWLRIVDSFKEPANMSRYFLLTQWINIESSNFYLSHEGDDGVPVIDKSLVKCEEGGGIVTCTFSPLDYRLLIEYDSRFSFTTPKSRLKELRENYGFRYIK